MEQRFYKVRLKNGRVIGPLELDRIRIFIAREKITGLEMARLYPTGDWKDINTYPEIAELLMQKLEGKLTVDMSALPGKGESDGNTMAALEEIDSGAGVPVPPAPPQEMDYPATPQLNVAEASGQRSGLRTGQATQGAPTQTAQSPGTEAAGEAGAPASADDGEKTMIVTADNERTMMVPAKPKATAGGVGGVPVEEVAEEPIVAQPEIAAEKTAMLVKPAPAGPPKPAAPKTPVEKLLAHKKAIVAGAVIVIVAIFMTNEPDQPVEVNYKCARVELPAVRPQQDPAKSEEIFKKALPLYLRDTVDGYCKAATLLKDAASWDTGNVRALCLLASCYMNLFDIVERNAAYFNTVTAIIERERAKGLDMAETVIADVELYLMLGNPDAAFTRIVEFTKTHSWGTDMIYYLALTFYRQAKYADALQQLSKIDPKDFFSPKISFLYGLIYEKNGQIDDAIKAYLFTLTKAKDHVKAHVHLAGLYFQKDNLPEAGKHADYVIQHKYFASSQELAKSYYYRAKMRLVANRVLDALKDLDAGRQLDPDDQDILMDYYTIKAKESTNAKGVKDAPALAKMFAFLAEGEKALKEDRIDDALAQFLSAREAYDKDPAPLLRLATVFLKKADPQSAIINLAKAKDLAPKDKAIYSKYIRTLINGYELTDAENQLKELGKQPGVDSALMDDLYGELFLKQQKYQEAASYLKRALQSTNYDSSVYVAFGSLMFQTNNFQDAAFYMGLAQRFDPFNVEATVTIGKALAEMDSLEKGIEFVQQQLQTSPNKAALLNGIAEIYLRKSKGDEALKNAENALATDPKFALAHKTRGLAYALMGRHKDALDALETYTNLAPNDATGHIERYKLFLQPDEKGRLDLTNAKSELLKVMKLYPHYPGIHFMMGNLLFRTGDLDKAAWEAEEEIKANPSFIDAFVLGATAYNKSKNCQKGVELATQVLSRDPNYGPALLQAGIANHCLKSYAAALAMIERAKAVDPGNADVYMALGKIYYDMQKYDQMKEAFKKYLEVYPDAPDMSEVEDYMKKAGGG